MKFKTIEKIEITDYEKQIGHELVVTERPISLMQSCRVSKYHVCFEGGEVMENGMLVGVFGDGNTVDQALDDYCNQISGKRMAFNAMTPYRINIDIPHLVHKKLLNK